MNLRELKELVPAAFAEHPEPHVTERYEFLPTMPIVETMLDKGWEIRSAYQNGKDDPYATHRIVFNAPGTPAIREVDDVFPTATLVNSHNRVCRAKILVGFFRTICSNQAQVSVLSHDTTKIHLHGVGFDSEHFLEKALAGFNDLPVLFKAMNQRILTPQERQEFGKNVLSIGKYSDTSCANLFTNEGASEILTPRRSTDRSMTLWHTYNVAQENVLYKSHRGIQEVNRNAKLNLELWELAKHFLN